MVSHPESTTLAFERYNIPTSKLHVAPKSGHKSQIKCKPHRRCLWLNGHMKYKEIILRSYLQDPWLSPASGTVENDLLAKCISRVPPLLKPLITQPSDSYLGRVTRSPSHSFAMMIRWGDRNDALPDLHRLDQQSMTKEGLCKIIS